MLKSILVDAQISMHLAVSLNSSGLSNCHFCLRILILTANNVASFALLQLSLSATIGLGAF